MLEQDMMVAPFHERLVDRPHSVLNDPEEFVVILE
jgi:hypothetical protein